MFVGRSTSLADLLVDRVTLHSDGVTLRHNVQGKGAVASYFSHYIERFTYTHRVLCGATAQLSSTGAVAFALYRDEGVAPITPRAGEEAAGAPSGSTVFGASFYEMETVPGASLLITDIYLTRQMTDEEAVRKLGGRPHADYAAVAAVIPAAVAEGSAAEHTAERAALHTAAAEAYNKAWATGDASAAAPLLAPSFVGANLLTGSVFKASDGLAAAVAALFERWKPVWHESVVAATPGNKVFTLWKSVGDAMIVSDDGVGGAGHTTFATAWGLTLLIFDDDDRVATALAFAPPLPGGRAALAAKE